MNRDTHNGGLVPDATVDRARLANLLKLLLISGGCLVSCFCIGCDDPLPAYIEPDKILELNVYPQVPPVIEYKHDDVNDVNLIQPRFTPEFLELNIEVKNIYEETLQGDLDIQGRIIITIGKDTSTKSTVNITRVYFTSAQFVKDNVLTIRPGQSVWLKVGWGYRMDNGNWVFTKIPATPGYLPPNTALLDYKPRQFTMKAQLKMFNKTAYFYKDVYPTLKFFGYIHIAG